jgi:hypothetical protein
MIARQGSMLDPIIEAVAVAYGFESKFDDELEIWIVTGASQNRNAYDFYWSSTESVQDFFEELKRFFMDQGREQSVR